MPKTLLSGRQFKASRNDKSALTLGDRNIPRDLALTGDVDIQATEGGEDGESKLPTFRLLANTGEPMDLPGFFDPVVVDLKGARFDKKTTPVIADHDTKLRIGHTTAQEIDPSKNRVTASGVVSSTSETANSYVEDARAGFPFQVSIGATMDKAFFVEAGDTVTVNGKTWKGPLIVASKARIRELTITVLGADNKTSARLAATHKDNTMNPFEKWVTETLGLDLTAMSDDQKKTLKAQWDSIQAAANPPATPPANNGDPTPPTTPTPGTPVQATAPTSPAVPTFDMEEHRRTIAAERRRVTGIENVVQRFQASIGQNQLTIAEGQEVSLQAAATHAIEQGWDADRLELLCRRAEYPTGATNVGGPAIHIAGQVRDMAPEVLSCAMIRASGAVPRSRDYANRGHEGSDVESWGWEHMYPTEVLEASDNRNLRNMSLHQMFDIIHAAAFGHSFSGNRRSDDFIGAVRNALVTLRGSGWGQIQASSGMSTMGATDIFDDAANKFLLAGYASINTTWQEWAAVRNVSDFKTHNLYRLNFNGAYEQVGADGELKHGTMSDTKYQHSADTYGKIYGLTRKHLINDDLSAFSALMTGLGVEGARSLEEVAYVVLLTAVGTTWVGGNNNLSTGAGSDLTIGGLSAAQQLFEDQTQDNAPIGIEPDRILVGTQDRVQSGQLFNDTEVRSGLGQTDTTPQFIRNPHQTAYRPVVSGYLNNTSILQRVANKGSAIPNQDTDQWFMFGNPNSALGATVVVSLLNGNRTPILESADAAFDVLGMQWRGYHDFGADIADPILSVRSAGA